MDFFKGVYYGVLNLDPTSIAFAILLLIIVLCIIRAMFTLAITFILVCIFIIGALGYTPQEIYYQAQTKIAQLQEELKTSAISTFADEYKSAVVKNNSDGTYEIKTKDLTISGKKGDSKITVDLDGEKGVFDTKDLGNQVNSLLENMINQTPTNGTSSS